MSAIPCVAPALLLDGDSPRAWVRKATAEEARMARRTSFRIQATLWLLAVGTVAPAEALDVLVFNSTRFVDSGQVGYPVGSQESDNVQAALAALGHT
jgi:hypothetical protein